MRRADAKRLWRDVQETAHPELRFEKAREANERSRKELARLRAEEAERTDTLAALARHPGNEPVVRPKVRKLRRLALVLVALDVPVQLLLTRAALPQIELWIVLAGAVALAGGLAAVIHLVTYGFLYDEDRPARSVRIVRWLAGVAVAAIALGATVFLFARQASPEVAPYLLTLTALSLWTVAEALPLAAGFFSAWAHMLAQPEIQEQKLRAVRARIDAFERLQEQLAAENRSLEAEKDERPQTELFNAPPAKRGAAVLGLLLLTTLAAQPANAQEPSGRLCAVMVDRTLSVDPEHREQAMSFVSRSLPELVRELRCGELLAGHFADEGAWAPRAWLSVPSVPPPRDCSKAEPPALEGTQAILAGFAGFRRHHERQAREACMAEEEARQTAYGRDLRTFLSTARSELGVPQLAEKSHTDVLGVVESLLETGMDAALLVTDGLDTAHDSVPALPGGERVVLLLVPASGAYGGRTATQQAALAWERAGVRTLPYTALIAPAGRRQLFSATDVPKRSSRQ